jgi:hypothetical protein
VRRAHAKPNAISYDLRVMRGGILRKHVRTGEVFRTATEADIENRPQSSSKIIFFLLDFWL